MSNDTGIVLVDPSSSGVDFERARDKRRRNEKISKDLARGFFFLVFIDPFSGGVTRVRRRDTATRFYVTYVNFERSTRTRM